MNNNHTLGFWTLGKYFLQLTNLASSKLIETGNAHFLISKHGHSVEEYDEITAWSDHNIGIPVLFDFYHGIELMLKGFLSHKGKSNTSHKFSVLLKDFEQLAPQSALIQTVKRFTTEVPQSSFMGRFLSSNSIDIDSWYEALKYPVSVKGKEFVHIDLKYGEDENIPFWTEIRDACKQIISEAYALSKEWHAI